MLKLNIQLFAKPKLVIETELDNKEFEKGIKKMKSLSEEGAKSSTNSIGKIANAYEKLSSTIDSQKQKLEKLKKEYGSVVLEQGKNSKEANELKKEIDGLNGELKQNETRLKESTKEVDKFSDEEEEATKKTGKFAEALSKGLKSAFKITMTAIGAVSGAMAGALANGVKFNSEIEQLQTSFEVMTGSAEKSREVIDKLKKVGAQTPYELKGLAQTTQTLMQYGLTADEAYNATINLGDIAQGNAEKMQSIALAFGQMSSLGKVTMQDIKQMINAGFNPLQAIAEMTGETMKEVNARYEEGKISVEEVTKAMQYASSENGKYYQSMEKQSKTLAGQVSTLKDNFDSLTGTLSEGLSKTISGEVLPSINNLLQNMETAFKEDGIAGLSKAVGDGIANMLTAIVQESPKFIDVALTIVENLIEGINKNLPKIVQSAITLVSNFTKGVLQMLPDILKLGINLIIELAKGITKELPTLIPLAIDTILTLVNTLLENIDLIIDAGIDLIMGLIDGIMNAIPLLLEKAPEILIKLVEALITNLPKLMLVGPKLILKLVEGIIKNLPSLIVMGPKMLLALVNGILNSLGKLGSTGGEIIKKIKESLKELPNKAKEWGKDMINGFVKGIKDNINKVKEGVSNVAQKVKNFLHFSKPDEGPLREYESWMPDMIDGLVKTLKKSSPKLIDEFENITENMNFDMDDIYKDMQKAIDFETSKMTANVQTNGTYQMAMAGLPEFNLLDNTNNTTQLVCDGKVLAEVVNTENKYREVAKA